MAIAADVLDRLRDVPIVDVARRYMHVEKENSQLYKAICPFHDDKDASLKLYVNTNSFYCFGCKAGTGKSDVIAFVQLLENCDFPQAVRILSEIGGVELRQDPESERIERKLAAIAHQDELFRKALKSHLPGQEYLKRRGILPSSWEKWGIGVVPHGTRYYNDYWNRLSFPIRDLSGRVRGWEFRSIDGSEPKTRITPNTDVFNKKMILPGIEYVSRYTKRILLVEGYIDMIALTQKGVPDVVATLSANLHKEQVDILKRRLAPQNGYVLLMYDGDRAGRAGTAKAVALLEKEGIPSKVVRLPDNLDPDDWSKDKDLFAIEEALSSAKPLIQLQMLHVHRLLTHETNQIRREFYERMMAVGEKYVNMARQVILAHPHHPNRAFYESWLEELMRRPLQEAAGQMGFTEEELQSIELKIAN